MKNVDRVFFAVKANDAPQILRAVEQAGVGFECVSAGEVRHVFATLPGLARERVLFTPNFVARAEYEESARFGCLLGVDGLHPLEEWGDVFAGYAGAGIMLRLDPSFGHGHSDKVRTAGKLSKFGIEDVARAAAVCAARGIAVFGLHCHVGSGVFAGNTWADALKWLLQQRASHFPGAALIDVGGGLGVADRPGGAPTIDLAELDAAILGAWQGAAGFEIALEPGRYIVAESGVLLAPVTQLKSKQERRFVGVNTGFGQLVRPAFYGSYHYIANLSRLAEADAPHAVDVVGNVCESCDVFGRQRMLPPCAEGDILCIATAGAYCASMAMPGYNRRLAAAAVFLDE